MVTRDDIDLVSLNDRLRRIVYKMRSKLNDGNLYDNEDLVQECFLKVLVKLDKFHDKSLFNTWAYTVARNHLISLARTAARKPKTVSVPIDVEVSFKSRENFLKTQEIRSGTEKLLTWLKWNPEEVEHGYMVLNILLWNNGNFRLTATYLSVHYKQKWTSFAVRRVIEKIKNTEFGSALCGSLGLATSRSIK